MRVLFAIALILSVACTAGAQDGFELVPRGWQAAPAHPDFKGRKFVSPDGSAWMVVYATPTSDDSREPQAYAYVDDERITYQRRTRRFVVVSGYRGDRIFYRKSNLACGGTRWHTISLEYPVAAKRQMDAVVTSIAHGMNRYDAACVELSPR
jgi:serine/threonine-protein kinase